jgi:hypothetical protein
VALTPLEEVSTPSFYLLLLLLLMLLMIIIINGVVLIMVEVEVVAVCNILTTSDTENFTELESELTTIYA